MGFLSHLAAACCGALLLAVFSTRGSRLPATGSRRLHSSVSLTSGGPGRLQWNETVLPENVIDLRLPTVLNPNYGLHVFALGKNGSLFHKFQTGPSNLEAALPFTPMSDWHCLTPNASLVFGNDPAVALNADGRIELFVGFKAESYDLWQMYQTDAKNPLAWSLPRAPSCLCGCPDPDPSKCTWCDNCDSRPDCSQHYWMGWCPFTTSDMELLLDPADQKLKLHYRNFDGHMYQLSQKNPSNSTIWAPRAVQMAIFE